MILLRSTYVPLVLAAGLVVFAADARAARSDLQPPNLRQKVVERAEALVHRADSDAARLPANPINPFDPTAGVAAPTPKVSEPVTVRPTLSEDQQLRAMADRIQPTGTISIGSDTYLLFGQKKFKVGDTLPIVFEGATYDVLVTDIQSTSFSIRLGNAELVRPIKPVNR